MINQQNFEEIRKGWAEESLRQEAERQKSEKLKKELQQIPLRFRGKTFSDYEVENQGQLRAKAIAERFVSTFPNRLMEGSSLIFYGTSGTGKTLLSTMISQKLLDLGYYVRYEPTNEFLKNLLEIKFKSQSAFNVEFDAYCHPQLLVIDEVTESISQSGSPAEIERQLLLRLINSRYEKKLCTLVISNREKDEIINRLGIPVTDRLFEKGTLVAFNWSSYRNK